MAEKRYYWLKLKEDYFNSPKIKKLRKIAGGDTYTIIYLKMQLLSIKNGGVIQFENIEPTLEEELALKLDEDIENVKITLAFLQSQSLMEMNENNEYLLLEASNCIGSEGQSAERKRRFDERKKENALLCNGSVTEVKRNYISISNSISNSNSSSSSNKEKRKVVGKEKEEDLVSYGEEFNLVKMTQEEYKKLVSLYGEDLTKRAINYLDLYLKDTPKYKRNHYLAIRRWVIDRVSMNKSTLKAKQKQDDDDWLKRMEEANKEIMAMDLK